MNRQIMRFYRPGTMIALPTLLIAALASMVYNRYDYADERRAALDVLGRYVELWRIPRLRRGTS